MVNNKPICSFTPSYIRLFTLLPDASFRKMKYHLATIKSPARERRLPRFVLHVQSADCLKPTHLICLCFVHVFSLEAASSSFADADVLSFLGLTAVAAALGANADGLMFWCGAKRGTAAGIAGIFGP